MSYRPITDVWILARPKIKFYGAYPSGFLERARNLLGVGVLDPVLHVCSGMIRHYPFKGCGPNDKTVDINEKLKPDYLMDVTEELPYKTGLKTRVEAGLWPAILADPPYTELDMQHYNLDSNYYPSPNALLNLCLDYVKPGGKVGILHYIWPSPDKKKAKPTAVIAVLTGYKQRIRVYSVFERL